MNNLAPIVLFVYNRPWQTVETLQTNQIVTLKEQIKILTNLEIDGILRKVDLVLKTPNTKEQSIFGIIYREGVVL